MNIQISNKPILKPCLFFPTPLPRIPYEFEILQFADRLRRPTAPKNSPFLARVTKGDLSRRALDESRITTRRSAASRRSMKSLPSSGRAATRCCARQRLPCTSAAQSPPFSRETLSNGNDGVRSDGIYSLVAPTEAAGTLSESMPTPAPRSAARARRRLLRRLHDHPLLFKAG